MFLTHDSRCLHQPASHPPASAFRECGALSKLHLSRGPTKLSHAQVLRLLSSTAVWMNTRHSSSLSSTASQLGQSSRGAPRPTCCHCAHPWHTKLKPLVCRSVALATNWSQSSSTTLSELTSSRAWRKIAGSSSQRLLSHTKYLAM